MSVEKLLTDVDAAADHRTHEILALLQSPICEYSRLRQLSTPAGDGIVDFNESMMACWEMSHHLPCGECWVCRQSKLSSVK